MTYFLPGVILFVIGMIYWYVRYPRDRHSILCFIQCVAMCALVIVGWPLALLVLGWMEFSGIIRKIKENRWNRR